MRKEEKRHKREERSQPAIETVSRCTSACLLSANAPLNIARKISDRLARTTRCAWIGFELRRDMVRGQERGRQRERRRERARGREREAERDREKERKRDKQRQREELTCR